MPYSALVFSLPSRLFKFNELAEGSMTLPIEYIHRIPFGIHSSKVSNLPVISMTENPWADTLSTHRGTKSKSTHSAIKSSIWKPAESKHLWHYSVYFHNCCPCRLPEAIHSSHLNYIQTMLKKAVFLYFCPKDQKSHCMHICSPTSVS